MDSLTPASVAYLHLGTGALLLFLIMVSRAQYSRAVSPDYHDPLVGPALLRWLPFFFVLMAAAFVRQLSNLSPLLGLELAAGLTLSLLHPVNALCFMIQLMIFRPWEIAPDNRLLTLMPRLTVAVCVFSYLIHPKQRALLHRKNLHGAFYLALFSAWVLLTTIKVPGKAAVVASYFDSYFKSLIVFGMAILFIESRISARQVELTLVISSLALITNGLYQSLSGSMTTGRLTMQKSSLLGDSNDMAAVIVMALPFVLVSVFRSATGPLVKLAGLLYAGLAVNAIWLTRSRGAMLAVVGQFLVYRLVRSRRMKLSLFFTVCLISVGYFGLLHLVPREANDLTASRESRLTYWKTAINMAAHNPVFGAGFNQYPENYMTYATGKVYERGARTAHSTWFLALGETGVLGLLLFCAFFISVARSAWRARAQRPAQLYALAGYGVAITFLSHTYSMVLYLLTGLIIASAGVKEKPTPR